MGKWQTFERPERAARADRREQILHLIATGKRRTVNGLAADLGISGNRVNHYIKELIELGLISHLRYPTGRTAAVYGITVKGREVLRG